jgi:hypothetical protein
MCGRTERQLRGLRQGYGRGSGTGEKTGVRRTGTVGGKTGDAGRGGVYRPIELERSGLGGVGKLRARLAVVTVTVAGAGALEVLADGVGGPEPVVEYHVEEGQAAAATQDQCGEERGLHTLQPSPQHPGNIDGYTPASHTDFKWR